MYNEEVYYEERREKRMYLKQEVDHSHKQLKAFRDLSQCRSVQISGAPPTKTDGTLAREREFKQGKAYILQ